MVLREKVRMLLDEGNDVINFLLLCVETAFSLLCHNKFVTTDTSAVAILTDIRGIAQPVTTVQVIPCVNQYVLDV